MHNTISKVETHLTDFLQPLIQGFSPVSLDEMEKVAFMDRFDKKFVFHQSFLPDILKIAQQHYSVLEINNHRIFDYFSVYYDTPSTDMYLCHHNRQLTRVKVRKREYLTTGQMYFEIKLKNNKGKTRKKRFLTDNYHKMLSKDEMKFIMKHTDYDPNILEPRLTNHFTRLTLAHKSLPERVTLDVNIRFRTNSYSANLQQITIAEVKKDAGSGKSDIERILKDFSVKTMKISKYCVGSVLLDKKLKYNRFKSKLLTLNKISNDNTDTSIYY
jgi:hypothetical protein